MEGLIYAGHFGHEVVVLGDGPVEAFEVPELFGQVIVFDDG